MRDWSGGRAGWAAAGVWGGGEQRARSPVRPASVSQHRGAGVRRGELSRPRPPPPHPVLSLTGRNAAEVTDGSAAGTLTAAATSDATPLCVLLFQRLSPRQQLSKNRKGRKKTSGPYLPGRLQVDTQPGVATQTGRTCSKSQRLFPTTLPQPRNIFRDSS